MPALNNMTIKVCYPFPEEYGPNYPKVIVLFRFACFYAVPLFIIGIFYVLIAKHLIYSASHVPGEIQGAQRQVINRALCQLLSYRHGISTIQTQLRKSCPRCICQRFPGKFYHAKLSWQLYFSLRLFFSTNSLPVLTPQWLYQVSYMPHSRPLNEITWENEFSAPIVLHHRTHSHHSLLPLWVSDFFRREAKNFLMAYYLIEVCGFWHAGIFS